MLNKNNYQVFMVAATDVNRMALCTIAIEGNRTRATDGRIMVEVSGRGEPEKEIGSKPILLSSESAKKICEYLSRDSGCLKIKEGQFEVKIENHDESLTYQPNNLTEFTFPNTDSLKKTESKLETKGIVWFNPDTMIKLMKLLSKIGCEKIKLEVRNELDSVKITGRTKEGQDVYALIMPVSKV